MKHKRLLKIGLSFLVPFIIGLILLPKFFDFELNQNGISLIALFAFAIFILVELYRKWGHQGQLPIFIGLFFIIGSLIALGGSMGVNGSEIMIDLTSRNQGFSLIGLAIGIIFLMSGLKSMGQASYFLGHVRGRG